MVSHARLPSEEPRHARNRSGSTSRGGSHARRGRPNSHRRGGGTRGQGGSLLFEMSLFLPAAVVIAIVIKTFLAQAFYIPSGSMETTIHGAPKGGDRVVVNKLTMQMGHKPQRGEVVVFRDELGWISPNTPEFAGIPGIGAPGAGGSSSSPLTMVKNVLTFIGLVPANGEKDLIKRVIALSGDEVSCIKGKISVNGTQLVEPYVFAGNPPCTQEFELTVPQGRMFVMGDHRSESADSAFHIRDKFGGTVSQSTVIGPAMGVVFPFKRMHSLPVPATFHQQFEPGFH